MRITIEVGKKQFEDLKAGGEFIEIPLKEICLVMKGKFIIRKIVAVSVSKKNKSMLIQVEGKR